jgi:hypothetical protein
LPASMTRAELARLARASNARNVWDFRSFM